MLRKAGLGSISAILLATALSVGATGQESPNKPTIVTKYVVKGPSTQNPDIQAWSTYLDTRQEADQKIVDLRHDYYDQNGLLYSSTDKPIDLKVVEVKLKVYPPPKPTPRPSDEPPSNQRKGDLPTTDSILKDFGRRNQLIQESLSLTERRKRLDDERNRLERERASLLQQGRKLRSLRQQQAQRTAPGGAGLNLIGSEWEIPSGSSIFGYRKIVFVSKDEIVRYYNVENSRRSGTWHSTGSGEIAGDFGNGISFTATISGDQLQINGVTLFKTKAGAPDSASLAKADAAAKLQSDSDKAISNLASSRDTELAQYLKDKQKYDAEAAQFEKENGVYKGDLDSLTKGAYNPPPLNLQGR